MNNSNNNIINNSSGKNAMILLIVILVILVVGIILMIVFKGKKYDATSNVSTPTTTTTTPPVVSTPDQQYDPYSVLGMSAYYEAMSFSQTDGWKDTSPANNTITPENTRGVIKSSGTFIYGGTEDGFKIPTSVIDQETGNYTMFYIGKYNGFTRKRIITDIANDWYSGFNDDKIGVTSSNVSASNNNAHTEWILVTDQPGRFRVNGTEIIVPNIIVSNISNVSDTSNISNVSDTSNISNVSNTSNIFTPAVNMSTVSNTSNVSTNSKPTQITVNYGGDVRFYSDWAFKEIIIYSKICDKREINIVEKYLENKYLVDLNKLHGIPENADMKDVTEIGVNDSFEGCTSSALMNQAKAFAFTELPAPKCLLYNNTDVLKKWSGDRSNVNTITSCSDKTKSVYSGCVDSTHGFEPIL